MYNNHTQNPADRKASPLSEAGLERSATKTAQKFAGHGLQQTLQMPRKLSRAERLAALDALMADFERKAEWVSVQLHHSLNADRWVNCWRVYKVPQPERAEFERIIVHLRSRDPVLRRAIEGIEWGEGVTVALNQGACNRG